MKKIFSVALACILLVGMAFTLVSCGGIKGTYEFSEGDMTQTVTFSRKALEMSMTQGDKTVTIEYTYELNEDETKITLTPADEEAFKEAMAESAGIDVSEIPAQALEEMLKPQEMTFEKGDDFVKIDGITYTKK